MSRLTMDYRRNLIGKLKPQMLRVGETIHPPFHPDGPSTLQNYITRQIPDEVHEALATLVAWRGSELPPDMYTKCVVFHIDGVGRYVQDLEEAVPVFSRMTELDAKLRAAIWEYIRQRALAQQLARDAANWLEHTLGKCITAGQVKRVLPEIVPYLTVNLREAIDNAARASCIPKNFAEDPAMKRRVLNLLATTSLLPAEPPDRTHLPGITTTYNFDSDIRDMRNECKEEFWWQ